MTFALAVHGGAGLIRRNSLTPQREEACREGLRDALEAGRAVLAAGGSALDAVEAAVVSLEDCPLFNAGRGSVIAANGSIEMSAAVMDGTTGQPGAVAAARTTRNPVRAARRVLETTPHILIVGPAADAFATRQGLEQCDPAWFEVAERRAQWERTAGGVQLDHGSDVYGTVGAVARDAHGHLAAATSTGGLVNKHPGRVGDTPVIGAGTWASDATCAVSGTGHGESFVRLAASCRVSHWMEMAGLSLEEAAHRVVHEELPAISGSGGVIAVDAAGRIAMPFNSGGMFRGEVTSASPISVAIW